jgi:hypothetical protein
MGPEVVVLVDEGSQGFLGLFHVCVVFEVNLIIFDGPPESFGDDVVQGPAFTVHTDFHFQIQKDLGKIRAGEGCPLIAVENLRLPINANSLFQCLDAEEPVAGIW